MFAFIYLLIAFSALLVAAIYCVRLEAARFSVIERSRLKRDSEPMIK